MTAPAEVIALRDEFRERLDAIMREWLHEKSLRGGMSRAKVEAGICFGFCDALSQIIAVRFLHFDAPTAAEEIDSLVSFVGDQIRAVNLHARG